MKYYYYIPISGIIILSLSMLKEYYEVKYLHSLKKKTL